MTTTPMTEQAGTVANTATGAAGDVVTSAKEPSAKAQSREVVTEARRQASDLYGQAAHQLRDQAGTQQQRAAGSLRRLGEELRSMADGGNGSGPATDLAREASERVDGVADWLEAREPGQLLDEVRDYARRHPGAFLAGAALLGVVAGRLTRGVMAGDDGGQVRP